MNEKSIACPRCGEKYFLFYNQGEIRCKNCGWETTTNGIFEGIPKNASACGKCLNNPENGGSGICNCVLGIQTIYY